MDIVFKCSFLKCLNYIYHSYCTNASSEDYEINVSLNDITFFLYFLMLLIKDIVVMGSKISLFFYF